jgi:hypothetical protein
MKSINITTIIFLTQLVSAQEISKLQFSNYQALWTYYSGSDSLSTIIQGIYPTPYPIINNNDLYIVSNIFDKTTNNGHITEKVDMATGNRIWSNYQYSTAINTREYAQSPYLENGQLGIHIYKESRTPPVAGGILWSRAVLKKTEYDAGTGAITNSFTTDSLDPLNNVVTLPDLPFIMNYKSYLYKDGIYTSYLRNQTTVNGYHFYIRTMDDNGHKLDSIGIELPISISLTNFQTKPISGDRFIYQMAGTSNGIKTCRILIIDKKLNVIQNQDIINLLPENNIGYNLSSVTDNSFYIVSNTAPDADGTYFLDIRKFDFNLNLIDTFVLDNVPLNYGIQELSDKSTIISYAKEVNGFSKLFILKSMPTGEIRLIKEISCAKSEDEVYVRSLYLTQNNDLLMNITHVDNSLGLNPLPKYSNWTLFSGVDLGISTETADQSKDFEFSMYPNPTSNQLQFSSDLQFDQVNIYSSTGHKIMAAKNNKSLEVSSLQSGLYIVELLNKNVSLLRRKFIKIE